jgi:hypothetical protein
MTTGTQAETVKPGQPVHSLKRYIQGSRFTVQNIQSGQLVHRTKH